MEDGIFYRIASHIAQLDTDLLGLCFNHRICEVEINDLEEGTLLRIDEIRCRLIIQSDSSHRLRKGAVGLGDEQIHLVDGHLTTCLFFNITFIRCADHETEVGYLCNLVRIGRRIAAMAPWKLMEDHGSYLHRSEW